MVGDIQFDSEVSATVQTEADVLPVKRERKALSQKATKAPKVRFSCNTFSWELML